MIKLLLFGIFAILFRVHILPELIGIWVKYREKLKEKRWINGRREWSNIKKDIGKVYSYDFFYTLDAPVNAEFKKAVEPELDRINKKYKINLNIDD